MPLAVSPTGSVSITVTAFVVAAVPTFDTTMEYVAPVCPCVNDPECVLVIVRSGLPAGPPLAPRKAAICMIHDPPDTGAVPV